MHLKGSILQSKYLVKHTLSFPDPASTPLELELFSNVFRDPIEDNTLSYIMMYYCVNHKNYDCELCISSVFRVLDLKLNLSLKF